MSDNSVPEEYVTLVQVLADDPRLRAWFDSLAAFPENRRKSELGRVAVQFRDAGQEALARLVQSLNEEPIYRMVKEVTDAFQRQQ